MKNQIIKTRIAFVNGIWQLCMVAAAMRQEQEQHPDRQYRDFLVIYTRKTANSALADFVLQQSSAFWNWKDATAIEWTPSQWDGVLRQTKQAVVAPILEAFEIPDCATVNQVWLCKLQFLDERLLADIFAGSELVLYEDGLHTYAPTTFLFNLPPLDLSVSGKSIKTSIVSSAFLLREVITGELNWKHQGVKRSHLRRIKTFYSVLGDQLQISNAFQRVPTEILRPALLQKFFSQLYRDLGCRFHEVIASSNSDRKVALFLGSNLSHLHSFPREVEATVFAQSIQQAIDRGYTIVWKEHPRAKEPLYEAIKQKIDSHSIIVLTAEQKLPIELLLAAGNVQLCCSTLSSALFYLKSIYGIQTVTCVEPLLPYLKGDFHALAKLTLDKIDTTL